MNEMARPKKDIDEKVFEKLCALQCTKLEICAQIDVTDKTLESWCKRTYGHGFSEVFEQKRKAGFVSLRASQFQRDKLDVEVEPVTIINDLDKPNDGQK